MTVTERSSCWCFVSEFVPLTNVSLHVPTTAFFMVMYCD